MRASIRKPAKGPAVAKVRRAAPGRLTAPQRELLVRLDHLRSATREIARAYLANLEHDIIELRETVASAKTPDGNKATLRAINRMADVVDDLALKPHKGRRSDLKKVEKAIRTLHRVVSKQGTANPGSRR